MDHDNGPGFRVEDLRFCQERNLGAFGFDSLFWILLMASSRLQLVSLFVDWFSFCIARTAFALVGDVGIFRNDHSDITP